MGRLCNLEQAKECAGHTVEWIDLIYELITRDKK
jgi:hypothetical protein